MLNKLKKSITNKQKQKTNKDFREQKILYKFDEKKKSENHMQSFVDFFTGTISGRSMFERSELRRLGLKLKNQKWRIRFEDFILDIKFLFFFNLKMLQALFRGRFSKKIAKAEK